MGDDKPLSRRASIRNLALFLAQFGVRSESGFVAAWHAYWVARGYKTIDAEGPALMGAVHRARRSRVRDYMRKVLRDCTEFHVEQGLPLSGLRSGLVQGCGRRDDREHRHEV